MDETQTLALLAFFDGRPEEAALARALLGASSWPCRKLRCRCKRPRSP